MISRDRDWAVEPTRLVFERGSVYRMKHGQVWGVPAWKFAKKNR